MSFEKWLEEVDKEIAEMQERSKKIVEKKRAEVKAREDDARSWSKAIMEMVIDTDNLSE